MPSRDVQLDLSETGYDEIAEKLDQLVEKIDELIERFDELGKKFESPEVRLAGEDEVTTGLDEIDEKLDEIGEKTEVPRVDVEGITEATAEIDELGDSLEEITPKAEETNAALGSVSESADNLTASAEAAGESQGALRDRMSEVMEATEAVSDWLEELAAVMANDSATAGALSDSFGLVNSSIRNVTNRIEELSGALGEESASLGLSSAAAQGMVDENLELSESVGDLRDRLVEVSAAADAENASVGASGASASVAATNVEFLDRAMSKATRQALALAAAGTVLDIDLSATDEIASRASSKLRELGYSEAAAAAGAAALAAAQAAADATMDKSGGKASTLEKILASLSPGNLTFGVGGIGAAFGIDAIMAEIGALVTGVSAALMGIVPAVGLAIPTLEKLDKAFDDTRAQLDKLPAAERGTILGIRELKSEYGKLAEAFAPDVFAILNTGVKGANNLLKDSPALARDAASGFDSLLKEFDRFTTSTGFKGWLKQVSPDIAPSIEAIGGAIGNVVVDWGKFMTRFSPKDIENAFHILNNVVNWWSEGFGHSITDVMTMWDDLSAAVKNLENWFDDVGRAALAVAGDMSKMGHDSVAAFDTVRHDVADFGHGVASSFDTARHAVATFAHDAAHDFDVFRAAQGQFGAFEHDLDFIFDHILDSGRQAFDDLTHVVSDAWGYLIRSTERDWDDIRHDIASVADWILDKIRGTGSGAQSSWDHYWSDIVSFTESIPGKVVRALDVLPGDMLRMGEDAIEGLLRGIESEAGDVVGYVENLASKVGDAFARFLGISSPSRVFYEHGQDIIRGLVMGLDEGVSSVHSAVDRVATATMPSGVHGAGLAAAGGAANVQVQLDLTGASDSELWTVLKKGIRIHGGNPSVLGR